MNIHKELSRIFAKATPEEWVAHAEKSCTKSGMSKWDFRLLDVTDDNGGDPYLELCEVYYNDKDAPIGYSTPCTGSETIEGMLDLLRLHSLALAKPILKKSDFLKETK
jgi:hypothetical protein